MLAAKAAKRHRFMMFYESSSSSYVTTIILICFFMSKATALNGNSNSSRSRGHMRDSVLSAADMMDTSTYSAQPDGDTTIPRHNNSGSHVDVNKDNSRRDVLLHLFGCFGAACGLSTYEDYDCVNLKPSRATLRRQYMYTMCNEDDSSSEGCLTSNYINTVGAATKGMGEGETERIRRFALDESVNSRDNIPSYNEIMLEHRSRTVTRWNKVYEYDGSSDTTTTRTAKEVVRDAVDKLYMAIKYLEDAAVRANDYDWDGLHDILRSPGLRDELAYACSVLHGTTQLTKEARDEIGFDWGSCAWRHCGAQADAQEAIAELDRSVGMLEPLECLFCLDIADRSLRDILSNIPNEYHPSGSNRLKVRVVSFIYILL